MRETITVVMILALSACTKATPPPTALAAPEAEVQPVLLQPSTDMHPVISGLDRQTQCVRITSAEWGYRSTPFHDYRVLDVVAKNVCDTGQEFAKAFWVGHDINGVRVSDDYTYLAGGTALKPGESAVAELFIRRYSKVARLVITVKDGTNW